MGFTHPSRLGAGENQISEVSWMDWEKAFQVAFVGFTGVFAGLVLLEICINLFAGIVRVVERCSAMNWRTSFSLSKASTVEGCKNGHAV